MTWKETGMTKKTELKDKCRKMPIFEKTPIVYMVASKKYGTLYIGVTSNLVQRIYQHKQCVVQGFTKRYKIQNLVYYEVHQTMEEAIKREKQIKKWNRQWKIELIESTNPNWNDLFVTII